MIDLNKEAEEHWKMQYIMALDESTKPYIIQDFIAGANSKYVQAKIIQAQIDVLNKTIDMFGNVNFTTTTSLIFELRQQLKQLENEANNKQNNP
jgi:polyhydroxyalkanoate synthesis regulator phasin